MLLAYITIHMAWYIYQCNENVISDKNKAVAVSTTDICTINHLYWRHK